MFKKPFTTKPATPLRSSERRALIKEIAASLAREFEDAEVSKLVPEGILHGKALTHAEVACTLYSDAHTSDCLFVRLGKDKDKDGLLFPTVYTLLKAGRMLPLIATPDFVLDKLSGGADLFLAGCSPESLDALPDLKQHDLVGVASINHPAVPRAVGQMAVEKRDLKNDSKGKAVHILQAYGDHLWNAGSRTEPDDLFPTASTSRAPAEDDRMQAVADGRSEAEGGAPESAGTLGPSDVDRILRTALLLAIKRKLSKDPKAFPMPASSVYSSHILPCRPATAGSDVDIKHSTHKKLVGFLKAAQKDRLLTYKETKADILVLSVNAEHPDVLAQQTYTTLADAAKQPGPEDATTAPEKHIRITELYKPHGSSLPFWSLCERSSDDLMTTADVKSQLAKYISEHKLAYQADAKYVKPDEAIQGILPPSMASPDAVTRQAALEGLLEGMQRWHLYEAADGTSVQRKGPGPRVEIAVKQRQGRKVVTIITGLEAFSLSAEEVAASLQILCASSTSVNELQQSTAKRKLHECTVQGDQTKAVANYLVDQGVPKNFIDTVPLKRK